MRVYPDPVKDPDRMHDPDPENASDRADHSDPVKDPDQEPATDWTLQGV